MCQRDLRGVLIKQKVAGKRVMTVIVYGQVWKVNTGDTFWVNLNECVAGFNDDES